MGKWCLILGLIGHLCTTVLGQVATPEYLWPTDASTVLTSSYGEYRSHRFHAGIDVKTWGQVGYKAVAVRSGYISRIDISPYGYGRSLYLKLDSGETALYGHLSRFSDAIESHVRREQVKNSSYSIELVFDPDQFVVEKGDLVAYTGQSGVGAPHLHFEIHDADGNPTNPLLKGYKLIDTIPPTIRRVMVLPLEAHTRVNGDLKPLVLLPKRVGPGKWVIEKPVTVYGRIGFAVSLFDEMDGVQNDYGAYINQLIVDNEQIFHAQYDWFPYDLNHHANLDRDYRALMLGNGYYQRLFRDVGNELPFYGNKQVFYGVLECAPGAADRDWLSSLSHALGIYWDLPGSVTVLEPGEHTFRIETIDFFGNKAAVTGKILAAAPTDAAVKAVGTPFKDGRYNIELDYFDTYARVTLQCGRPLTRAPELLALFADGYHERLPLLKQSTTVYHSGLPLYSHHPGPVRLQILEEKDGERVVIHEEKANYITVRVAREKTVATADGNCEILFDEESLFRSIFVRARTTAHITESLPVVGEVYDIDPCDVALNQGVTIRLHYPPGENNLQQLAVYGRPPRNGWDFVGNKLDPQAGHISGRTRTLGSFCLMRDDVPPDVRIVAPVTGARLTDRRPQLKAHISDALSGLGGERNWSMYLDGEKIIAEYDYESKLLFCRPEQPLGAGRHELVVQASDRCGNETRRTHLFWIK